MLSFHTIAIEAQINGRAREIGVAINMLRHAINELAALGLLPKLDRTDIRTRELI